MAYIDDDHAREDWFERQSEAFEKKDWPEVIKIAEKTIKQYPAKRSIIIKRMCTAYARLGQFHAENKAYQKALFCFEKSYRLCPCNAAVVNEMGNIFSKLNDFEKARRYYAMSVAFDPGYLLGYVNLAYAYHRLGLHDMEYHLTQYVLKCDPDNQAANWHDALWTLLRGDLKNGWKKYHHRLKHPLFIKQNKTGLDLDDLFYKKYWDGKAIPNKRLLVFAEQGYGDFIQFVRYLPLLKRRRIKIILACSEECVSLVQSWKCIEKVIVLGEKYPKYDRHVFLLSLPEIFKTTLDNIPNKVPYINVPKDLSMEWRKKIADHNRMKVGICFQGSQRSVLASIRNCSLEVIAPILGVSEIDFYQLQIDGNPVEMNEQYGVIDLTADIKHFMDTAALIDQLDLVICVETAVAHLAGAMNKPVWILLAKTPAWRWLLDRNDSPWYPSARLFRQSKLKEWQEPVNEIVTALKNLLS